jgi:DNA processing protein
MVDPLVRLAVARLSFLRCREKVMVEDVVLSQDFFGSLRLGDVEQIVGRRVRTNTFDPSLLLREAENDSFFLSAVDADTVAISEPEYPPQLREIFDPPYVIFVRGRLADPGQALIAIVGTRAPSSAGLDAAHALGTDCGEAGIPVVSGLALGIDSAAHAGVVKARGTTIAVLGSGIDDVYPRSHKSLAARILDVGGALISEYPPRTQPRKYHFPARNRIISGLCRSVVVVEAPERSGALITADYALDQGRDLFVHAVSKSSRRGEGAQRLISDGAPVIRGLVDITRDWSLGEPAPAASIVDTAIDRAHLEGVGPGAHVARSLQKELGL